jgi:hypothetical protein
MMTSYTCPRCAYQTIYKKDFVSHLNRKFPCPPSLSNVDASYVLQQLQKLYHDKPFSCKYCKRRFSHKPYMYTHQKSCPSTFFHINPIEYANTSFVSLDKLIEIGGKRPGQIHIAISKLVKTLFCNIHHPENYSVYIPNKKEKRALLWNATTWIYLPLKDAVSSVRNKVCSLLIDYYQENIDDFKMFIQQEWNAFINRMDRNEPSLFKKIDKGIECDILNHTFIIKDFIKGKHIYADTKRFHNM